VSIISKNHHVSVFTAILVVDIGAYLSSLVNAVWSEERIGQKRHHSDTRREFEIRKEEWCIKICRKNVKTFVEMEEDGRGSNLETIPQIYWLAFLSKTEISSENSVNASNRRSSLSFHLLALFKYKSHIFVLEPNRQTESMKYATCNFYQKKTKYKHQILLRKKISHTIFLSL